MSDRRKRKATSSSSKMKSKPIEAVEATVPKKCAVNRITLTHCVHEEEDSIDIEPWVPNENVQAFRELLEGDPVQENDWLVYTDRSICEEAQERAKLKRKITEMKTSYLECQMSVTSIQSSMAIQESGLARQTLLFKLTECYNHFAEYQLLPKLKTRYCDDVIVKTFQHWNQCTNYLGPYKNRSSDRHSLQDKIDNILVSQFGFDIDHWKALGKLIKQRNADVHLHIEPSDIDELSARAADYNQFSVGYFQKPLEEVVQSLATVLRDDVGAGTERATRNLPVKANALARYLPYK